MPPKAIVDILDAPPPPTMELSPTRDVMALIERASMPSIAELSQPVLRIAGRRINPRTNGPHRAQNSRSITLKTIADGSEKKVTVPPNPLLTWIGFSPDGKRFAFTQTRENGIELWVGETASQVATDEERLRGLGSEPVARMPVDAALLRAAAASGAAFQPLGGGRTGLVGKPVEDGVAALLRYPLVTHQGP